MSIFKEQFIVADRRNLSRARVFAEVFIPKTHMGKKKLSKLQNPLFCSKIERKVFFYFRQRLLDLLKKGYKLRGKHHKIYLGDSQRTKPENLRTVLRHPIKK